MICSVRTLGISGIQGSAVTAECYISQGLPGFDIVGLPDAAVKEARDRVRAAAKSSGLSFPVSRITVNLAPASQKKAGTHYDLPILLSILAASGSVRRPKSTSAFLGELSLDGTIRPISGVLPMALAAKREGIQALFVPAENAPEATLARGPAVYPIHTVAQLAAGLNGETTLEEEPLWVPSREDTVMPDFKDVLGQENVKRALEVAAAGSSAMAMNVSKAAGQCCVMASFSQTYSAGTVIALMDGQDALIAAFKPGKQFDSIVISAPAMQEGDSYSIYAGGEAQTDSCGFAQEQYVPGELIYEFTFSQSVMNVGSNGSQPGMNGMPGGGMQGGGPNGMRPGGGMGR